MQLYSSRLLIKIGGNCLNNGDYDLIGKYLSDLYSLGVVLTIVHGGGPQIDRIMEKRGIPLTNVNGLRAVPDRATLDAVIEGLREVNYGLVNAINQYAKEDIAVGLTKERIISAKKMAPVVDKETGKLVDLGFVGEVMDIDIESVGDYLKKGKIPLLWCIGYGEKGERYNINADMVGEAFAPNYSKYILLTSVGGYLEDGKIVEEMTLEQAKEHNATGGMSLKLDSIIRVLETTNLDSVEIFSLDKGKGTIIKNSPKH